MSVATVSYFAGISFRRRTPLLPAAAFRPPKKHSTVEFTAPAAERRITEKKPEVVHAPAPAPAPQRKVLVEDEVARWSMGDFFEQAKVLIESGGGSGPPRWFSPSESSSRIADSPLLLYLPGIDGVGLGLFLQQQKLGKIFEVWCLHIPVKDRTSFQELVRLVEEIVRSENRRCPHKPIYLVGESLGACLALAVAARSPDIDLVLILANPATSYNKSQLQSLLPLLEVIPSEPIRTAISSMGKGLELQQTLEQLLHGLGHLSSYISVLADLLPRDTLLWKLQMMRSASSYANSRIHAVKAEVLIIASGRDPLQPNLEEAERIRGALPKQEIRIMKSSGKMPKCEIRNFNDCGHFLLLEEQVDLVTILKGACFYRCGKIHDYVSDYLPPTESEFKKITESVRWIEIASGPVMLSTLEDGKIVRGLEGIPTEGPALLVGNHMLMGLDLVPLVKEFVVERNIHLRGIAHPMLFVKLNEDYLDLSTFDAIKMMGGVPVSASNFYKLLSSGSHVLLYPGGMREALHKRGEEYQLFWPEKSEFVRMAARFGAKIIPFGVVGEDDICELVADDHDQMNIPFLRERIEKGRNDIIRVRTGMEGEVANEVGYIPIVLPKLPGRFYYMFGKPIETAGLKEELKNREKANEMYLQVKSEVEQCISYLKEKREKDPFRSLVARKLYQATHGSTSEVPTFEI